MENQLFQYHFLNNLIFRLLFCSSTLFSKCIFMFWEYLIITDGFELILLFYFFHFLFFFSFLLLLHFLLYPFHYFLLDWFIFFIHSHPNFSPTGFKVTCFLVVTQSFLTCILNFSNNNFLRLGGNLDFFPTKIKICQIYLILSYFIYVYIFT